MPDRKNKEDEMKKQQGIGPLAAGLAVCMVLGAGCKTTTRLIDPDDPTVAVVAGVSEADIRTCVRSAVASMLASSRLNRTDGARYVVNIENIVNDTLTRGRDADALSEALGQSLREELMNSGKIVVYNKAVAQYASNPVKPQLVLYGRLTSRFLRQDNKDQQIEYNMNLQLVEIDTGLEFWQKRVFIGKLADRNAVAY